jgi:hypothetical protein
VARRRTVDVVGETQGSLYLSPNLPAGTVVVTEGRSNVRDGDRVRAAPPPARQAQRE